MPLTNVKLLPGFDKTDTPSGAEGRWIDGDFVRFRYAQPEKIGGFAAIFGTGGSGTNITLASTTGFSATGGTILVDVHNCPL